MSNIPTLKPYAVYRICPACDELYRQGRPCPCQREPGLYPRWARACLFLGVFVAGLLAWAGALALGRWVWQLIGGA